MNTLFNTIYNLGNFQNIIHGLRFYGDPGCHSYVTVGCGACGGPCSEDGKICYSTALGGAAVPSRMRGGGRGCALHESGTVNEFYYCDLQGDVDLSIVTDTSASEIPGNRYIKWEGSNCLLKMSHEIRYVDSPVCDLATGTGDACAGNLQGDYYPRKITTIQLWRKITHLSLADWVGLSARRTTYSTSNGYDGVAGIVYPTYDNTQCAYVVFPGMDDCMTLMMADCSSESYDPYQGFPMCPVGSVGVPPTDDSWGIDGFSLSLAGGSDVWERDCCEHGHNCMSVMSLPQDVSGGGGACCATFSVGGIMPPDDEATCYFGYPPAKPSNYVHGVMKHYDCTRWVSKEHGCAVPYPYGINVFGHAWDPNANPQWLKRWSIGMVAQEGIVTPDSMEKITIGAGTKMGWGPIINAETNDFLGNPADLAGVPLTGYGPLNIYGANYQHATGHVSFGGQWDSQYTDSAGVLHRGCGGDIQKLAMIDVWGWRLKYQDNRGIDNSIIFKSTGAGLKWSDYLHGWQLIGDISTRPGAMLLSIEGSCSRLGMNHGFCFDHNWLNYATGYNEANKDSVAAAATCRVIKIIEDDVARWQYGGCNFMPGSQLRLEPVFQKPLNANSGELEEGTLCEVQNWALYWNWDGDGNIKIITLSFNSVDDAGYLNAEHTRRRWTYTGPIGQQYYTLDQAAYGQFGEGNYKLTIDLKYDNNNYLFPYYWWDQYGEEHLYGYMAFSIIGNHYWEFAPGTIFSYQPRYEYDEDGNQIEGMPAAQTYTVWSIRYDGAKTIIYVFEYIPPYWSTEGDIIKLIETTFTAGSTINCCYGGLTIPVATDAETNTYYHIERIQDPVQNPINGKYSNPFIINGDHAAIFTSGTTVKVVGSELYESGVGTYYDDDLEVFLPDPPTIRNYDSTYVLNADSIVSDIALNPVTNTAIKTTTLYIIKAGNAPVTVISPTLTSLSKHWHEVAGGSITNPLSENGSIEVADGNLSDLISNPTGGVSVPFTNGESAILIAGGPLIEGRGQGCVSECEAASWKVLAEHLPILLENGDIGETALGGSLKYIPSSNQWWFVTGGKTGYCITVHRAYDQSNEYKIGGSNKLGKYVAYISYLYNPAYDPDKGEGPITAHEHLEFDDLSPSLHCTDIAENSHIITGTNANGVYWTLQPRTYTNLYCQSRRLTLQPLPSIILGATHILNAREQTFIINEDINTLAEMLKIPKP
jgi:hypothetical protein